MSNSNPMQGFFRKVKLQLQLPSRGQWYPKDSLTLNENEMVDVLSMTASDDIKFRTCETNFSGSTTYELIKSCIPSIKTPEQMPSIDLDTVLLAIRKASYGDTLKMTVDVPKTSLTRVLTLNIQELLNDNLEHSDWDDTLIINNPATGEELKVITKPNTLTSFFAMTKSLVKQNQTVIKIAENADLTDDVKLESLGNTIKDIGDLKIKLVVDSIISISTGSFSANKTAEIENAVRNIDVEYFNAIETHLGNQRKKYNLKPILCISTEEEVAAGAPKTWNAEISFIQSDFFKVDDQTSV